MGDYTKQKLDEIQNAIRVLDERHAVSPSCPLSETSSLSYDQLAPFPEKINYNLDFSDEDSLDGAIFKDEKTYPITYKLFGEENVQKAIS